MVMTGEKPMRDSLNSETTTTPTAEEIQLSVADPKARKWRFSWREVAWGKIVLFIASLFLFILGITQMKEGARDLAPLIQSLFSVTHPLNSLGFGWLFAYIIMSGSPVAAAALTFFDAGVIDEIGAFMMITGSRLGASFIVLFIGFIYVIRGQSRRDSLSMGLLSLTVTGSTFLMALAVGIWLLQSGILHGFQLESGTLLNSITDSIFNPIIDFLLAFLPSWALFITGMVTIMVSFALFDRCLPEMSVKESHVGRVSRLIYRPWVMFLLGASITLISMSVSVSLSILVPLSNRGFVRRENVIPYIMGANVTTFIDTLLAAVLLNNPLAFTVVLAQMISIIIVSVLILSFIYRPFAQGLLSFAGQVTQSNRNLTWFMLMILIVPILLMLL
jgi:solute carrier family 34 (sodium-dependent phosphate cotransporter)